MRFYLHLLPKDPSNFIKKKQKKKREKTNTLTHTKGLKNHGFLFYSSLFRSSQLAASKVSIPSNLSHSFLNPKTKSQKDKSLIFLFLLCNLIFLNIPDFFHTISLFLLLCSNKINIRQMAVTVRRCFPPCLNSHRNLTWEFMNLQAQSGPV